MVKIKGNAKREFKSDIMKVDISISATGETYEIITAHELYKFQK